MWTVLILVIIVLVKSTCSIIQNINCNITLAILNVSDDIQTVCRWNFGTNERIFIQTFIDTDQCQPQQSSVDYTWDLLSMVPASPTGQSSYNKYKNSSLSFADNDLPPDIYALNLTAEITLDGIKITLNKMGYFFVSCWPSNISSSLCTSSSSQIQSKLQASNSSVQLSNSIHCKGVNSSAEVGYLTISRNTSEAFYFVENSMTYTKAKELCENKSQTLVKIDGQTKLSAIQTFILSENNGSIPSNDIWIGMVYNSTSAKHEWFDGDPVTWTDWHTGEPNGLTRRVNPEHCVRIDRNSFKYRTRECSKKYFVLCEANITTITSGSIPNIYTGILNSSIGVSTGVSNISVEIRCLTNCGLKVNPGQKVSLYAECVGCNQSTEYHWKHLSCPAASGCNNLVKDENQIDKNYFSTVVPGINIANRNLITLNVTLSSGDTGSVEYSIIVNDAPQAGSCIITPVGGYNLLTAFDINCHGFNDSDLPLTYYFYYKSPATGELSSLYTGGPNISTMYLQLGLENYNNYTYKIVVVVKDKYGMQNTTEMTVQVLPFKQLGGNIDTLNLVNSFMGANNSILTNLISSGDNARATSLLNTLSASINIDASEEPDSTRAKKRTEMRDSIMKDLSTLPISTVAEVEQMSNLLNTVTAVKSELSSETQEKASDLYSDMADSLQNQVNVTTSSAVENIAGLLLNGATRLLDISIDKGGQELDKIPSMTGDNDTSATSISNLVDKQKQEQIKNATNKILKVVETVADAVLDLITPDDNPSLFMTDSMNIVIKKSTTNQLSGINFTSQRPSQSGDSYGIFTFPNSTTLAQDMSLNSSEIGLQVMFSDRNPFTWDVSAKNITSPVLNVMLKDQNKRNIEVHNLQQSVDIVTSVQGIVSESSVHNISAVLQHEDSGTISLYNDRSVITMTMSAAANRTIVLHAVIVNITVPLKVLSKFDDKPTLPEIYENGTIMDSQNNFTIFLPTSTSDDNIYVGIILDDNNSTLDILRNFSTENDLLPSIRLNSSCTEDIELTLPIQIDTYTTACLYWEDSLDKWSTEGCQVSEPTTTESLHCLCTHLTAFSGSFFVLPNFVDPFVDAALFLTFFDNPVVVCIVIVIWCAYFFLLFWARKQDRQDMIKIGVTALSDNRTDDKYMYLVCIITGWWKDAGTTAGVSMYMTGVKGQSSKHSLSDKTSERQHFQAGSEDWFVITTPDSLGDLKSLTVWHDNTGFSPSWNLTRIVVEDIQTKDTWTFLFGDWLAVDKGIFTTTVRLTSCTQSELKSRRKQDLLLKSSQDIRNGHLWISILSKPPHSTFTRVQRLTCALSLLLTTMLTNIMFHGIPTDDPEDQKTIGHITLSLADIVIGIESAVIMFPINLIIVQLFMKTKAKPLKSNGLIALTSEKNKQKSVSGDKTREDLEEEANNKRNSKIKRSSPKLFPWWFLYIAWSLALATALISSYFVMLYGLKYGYQKSVDFVLSFFTSFFQSAFIMQPVKVMIIALILMVILKRPLVLESRETSAVYALKTPSEDEDAKSKLTENSRFIPNPLSNKLVAKAKERLRIEGYVQETILNTVLYFIFALVLLFMVHGHRNIRDSYLCTKTIEDIFVNPLHSENTWIHRNDLLAAEKIKTIPLFWEYMKVKVAHNLDEMNSKNRSVLSPNSYHHLVGYYRLRQLRVKGLCERVSTIFNHYGISMECKPSYSIGIDDTAKYDKSWNRTITATQSSIIDEWTFQSAWKLKTLPFMGKYTIYGGGGYVAELKPNKNHALQKLKELETLIWLDDKTRGVFLEFTLYNPNVNLFSVVMILFECTGFGRIFPYHQVFTSKLYHYSSGFEKFVSACEVMFLLFNICFTYTEIRRIRKYGRQIYFNNFWNWIELIQIVLSYIVIGLFFQRMVVVSNIIQEYIQSHNKAFVNFYVAVYWDFILTSAIASLVLLVVLKFFKVLRFNKNMFRLSDTLHYAKVDLHSFLFTASLLVFSFSHFGYLVFGSSLPGYKSVGECFITLFNFALGVSDFDGLTGSNRILGPVFYFAFVFGVMITFLTIFIAIMNFAISRSKQNQERMKNELEVVDYIWDRISALIFSYIQAT